MQVGAAGAGQRCTFTSRVSSAACSSLLILAHVGSDNSTRAVERGSTAAATAAAAAAGCSARVRLCCCSCDHRDQAAVCSTGGFVGWLVHKPR